MTVRNPSGDPLVVVKVQVPVSRILSTVSAAASHANQDTGSGFTIAVGNARGDLQFQNAAVGLTFTHQLGTRNGRAGTIQQSQVDLTGKGRQGHIIDQRRIDQQHGRSRRPQL